MKFRKTSIIGLGVTFVKATLIGGMVFLLPLVVISVLLGHAMGIAVKIIQPGLKILPDTVASASLVTLASVLALLLVALMAGLFARTRPGRRVTRWFEDSMLSNVPQYQIARSMAEGFAQFEGDRRVAPALVSIEDGWQLCYVLDNISDGWVGVFLPQAPTPMSGNIMYFPRERIRPLEITMVQAMSIIKRMGVGSADALKGVDLTLPATT